MHRCTERITVTTTSYNTIAIAQGDAEDADQVAHISPDQVEVFIERFREARKELQPES